MIFRTLLAGLFFVGALAPGGVSAQVLLCPEPPLLRADGGESSAEAEQLLTRLTVALDLHGHRGIDESAIIDAHADIPNVLLEKLGNVAEQCAIQSGDLAAFHEALPGLRKTFLDAVGLPADVEEPDLGGAKIANASNRLTEAEQVERAIDLSVRELWRKLWFRPGKGGGDLDNRWAVIVASPTDAENGWDMLGEHQQRWKDAYFQLHQPYYGHNPHHAIVVGRRLPKEQADRLRDYAIELGMAEDAFIWPLPIDAEAETQSLDDNVEASVEHDQDDRREQDKLDLSVLQD